MADKVKIIGWRENLSKKDRQKTIEQSFPKGPVPLTTPPKPNSP